MSLMQRKLTGPLLAVVAIVYATTLLTSCASYKKSIYFQDIPDSLQAPVTVPVVAYEPPKIKPNDILSISVQTIEDKDIAKAGATTAPSGQGSSAAVTGYKVDENGDVDVPMVGTVHLAGMTTSEAKEAVRTKAKHNFVDPVVNVAFANHFIDVIGEVSRNGRIPLPDEKVSIIDAISMAGDLGIQGKRYNVLLMRDEGDKKVCTRFNLNSTKLFQSPYYYVKSGDIIYVEPNKAKSRNGETDYSRDRYIGYIASFVSVGLALYNIIYTQSRNR
ncbi:MAG: polysaccharide biosynthesis/export family protein [Flavipsychrobacter sp.]